MENKTFEIQRPLGILTISEDTINNMIENSGMLEAIILMYKNNSDTWDDEFTREESDEFLLEYFLKESGYDKDYIKSVFSSKPLNK